MKTYRALPWIYLISVWFANINDLIRGHWFYQNTSSILWWNVWGILALFAILLEKEEKEK